MTSIPYVCSSEVAERLSWRELADWLVTGHRRARAQIGDVLLGEGGNHLLTRSAWVSGYGIGVKAASVFPGNSTLDPELPSAHSVVTLFDATTGAPKAIVDGMLVTRWKTAGDSVLGARYLARDDSQRLLIIGAGTVADSVIDAYRDVFAQLRQIEIWNRTHQRAVALAQRQSTPTVPVVATQDLAAAAGRADIIVCATMSSEPVLLGEWVNPGSHIDLIGAYTPTMREVDDNLIRKSRLYVDARETAVHDIGELAIPLTEGLIVEDDILGDLYDLSGGSAARETTDDITLYKNGGGAHLDVMTATYILSKC